MRGPGATAGRGLPGSCGRATERSLLRAKGAARKPCPTPTEFAIRFRATPPSAASIGSACSGRSSTRSRRRRRRPDRRSAGRRGLDPPRPSSRGSRARSTSTGPSARGGSRPACGPRRSSARVTLAAALYTFLYRFWGGMPAALQAGVVVALPLLLVPAWSRRASRADALRHAPPGLLAATRSSSACTVLAALFDVALPSEALLAWAALLRSARVRVRAQAPPRRRGRLSCSARSARSAGATATASGTRSGAAPRRAVPAPSSSPSPASCGATRRPASACRSRVFGLLAVFVPLLVLGRVGSASVLLFSTRRRSRPAISSSASSSRRSRRVARRPLGSPAGRLGRRERVLRRLRVSEALRLVVGLPPALGLLPPPRSRRGRPPRRAAAPPRPLAEGAA